MARGPEWRRFILSTPTPYRITESLPMYLVMAAHLHTCVKLRDYPPREFWLNMNLNIWIFRPGLCTHAEDCHKRANGTDLGSSTNWAQTFQLDTIAFLSPDQRNEFRDWNLVFVPYCSGDMHMGGRWRKRDLEPPTPTATATATATATPTPNPNPKPNLNPS